ncbi:MAG: DNA methyltransferase [Patescibacteria group bacterium]|jgi:site-specific DNA-methyltransferase (adenine-specific)
MTTQLIFGDCTSELQKIPDNSIDFCWTDPPYNVGKDYGNYKDNVSDAQYLDWCTKWINQLKRITNNNIAVYVPTKYILEYWNMLGSDYRQIILSYSPEGAFRFGFVNQFSSILTNAKPVIKTKNVWHNTQMPGLGYFFKENNFDHPGYTSQDITGRVIKSFTGPGQSVIDPFCGTGTTGVECVKYERSFTGIEQEQKWFDLAERRIHDAQQQMRLGI